jgi:zinc finger protein
MQTLEGQTCPVCIKPNLTLSEDTQTIPHFGEIFILSMSCEACGYRKTDVDSDEERPPVKYELSIDNVKDMSIRVVRGSEATIRFPEFKITVDPNEGSNGYVANVEKVYRDLLDILNMQKEGEESKAKKKKLRQYVDDVLDIIEGKKKATLVIEDPAGVSAILSDKATKTDLKVKEKK